MKKEQLKKFLKDYQWVIIGSIVLLIIVFIAEFAMDRLIFGTDGKFGLWEGDIWSSEQSQRLIDPYSFSHVLHGILFYLLLWLIFRKMDVKYRLLLAVLLESTWEIFENTPFLIERYRTVTISLGYYGDSIINSMSDVVMMIIGFVIAQRSRVLIAVIVAIALEVGMLLWVKDNLILNLIMLIYPIEAIKLWQSAGHIVP